MLEQWEKSCEVVDEIDKAIASRIQTEYHYRSPATEIDTGLPDIGGKSLFDEFHCTGRACILFFICSAMFVAKGISFLVDLWHGHGLVFNLLFGPVFLWLGISWAWQTDRHLREDLVRYDAPISEATRHRLNELVDKNRDVTSPEAAAAVSTYRELTAYVVALREALAMKEKERRLA